MERWRDQADDLLYDGETIDREVEMGSTTVVVTSHRVLAFTPEGGGANFRQVDRPNVSGVGVRNAGDPKFLRWGGWAIVSGLVLLLAGWFLPIDGFLAGMTFPSSGAARLGVGGVLDMVRTGLDLLRQLDDLLVVGGALFVLLALVPLGVYLWSRERVLVVGVAGDGEAIRVPVQGSVGPEVAAELEDEILPESVKSEVDDGYLASLLS